MLRIGTTMVLTLAAVVAATSAPLRADPNDWPQWRGPHRDGISTETGLLKQWPAEGPKLLWKANDLGGGYSTPSVANGRIYLLGSRGSDEYVLGLDAKDGKQVWATKIGPVGKDGPPSYPGPRSTPTVDGDVLYTIGSDGDLVCLETAGGTLRWHKHFEKDFGGARGRWAFAESPLIDGDVLICTPGGTEATLVALQKKTGDLIWKSAIPAAGNAPDDKPAGYASPMVTAVGGIKQYVQFIASGIVGVDAKTGQLLWRYVWSGNMNSTTPIIHDNCVFVAEGGSTRTPGSALVKLTAEGQTVTATKVFQGRDLPNHHGGVVRIGDYLYGTSSNSFVCLDFKTGQVKWQERSVGKGSISAADGMLYVRGEAAQSAVALVEPSPDGYKEKGRFNQPDRQESGERNAWPHPVIANGRLYLRDGKILLCYDVKAN